MAHHLRSQRRSVDSVAAELESTAAEVDPEVADIKSATAEVESRGGGAPISEGGGPRCFNRRQWSLNRRRFGGGREQPCPHRTLLLLPFVLHVLHSVRGWAYPQPRLDVCWIGYVFSTYRNFVLFIFLPILYGYVSTAYPMRIHIRYGIRPSLAYRGNVGCIIIGPRSQYKIRSYPIHSCVCTFASHSSRSSTTPAMAKPQLASAKSPVRTSRRGTSHPSRCSGFLLLLDHGSISWHILDQKRGGGAATARGGR